jgi:hypothetical protein
LLLKNEYDNCICNYFKSLYFIILDEELRNINNIGKQTNKNKNRRKELSSKI